MWLRRALSVEWMNLHVIRFTMLWIKGISYQLPRYQSFSFKWWTTQELSFIADHMFSITYSYEAGLVLVYVLEFLTKMKVVQNLIWTPLYFYKKCNAQVLATYSQKT